jgi:hypothetical protein
MTESPAAATDRGLVPRAIGVIVSPADTFRTVVAYPRPASILLLVSLVMGLALGLPQLSDTGRQAALDSQVQQIERFTGQPVSAEMYDQMEARSRYNGYLTMGLMFIWMPVMTMLFAALYWFAFNVILGGTAAFGQVLGVVAHGLVVTAFGAVVGAPIMYLQGAYTQAGPFNLGALAPMLEPGSFFGNLLGSISFFAIWQIIVTAIGLGVLYRRSPANIAITLTAIYLAIMAAIASF